MTANLKTDDDAKRRITDSELFREGVRIILADPIINEIYSPTDLFDLMKALQDLQAIAPTEDDFYELVVNRLNLEYHKYIHKWTQLSAFAAGSSKSMAEIFKMDKNQLDIIIQIYAMIPVYEYLDMSFVKILKVIKKRHIEREA